MLTPIYSRQFERDVKRMQRRGKNIEKLKIIICSLVLEEPLDPIHRNHKLIGNWGGTTGVPHRVRLAPDLQNRRR